jgi:hypothetical protein
MLGWVLSYRRGGDSGARRAGFGARRAGTICCALAALSGAVALAQGCGVSTNASVTDGGFLDTGSSDDGGPLFQDASLCAPGDVQTYVAKKYHPATAKYQGVCTQAQITGFYEACLVGPDASTSSCAAFMDPDASTGACAACILTPDSASAYGPLIDHKGFITPNVGGCIELTDPNGLTCAKAQQALLGCQLAACEALCPVHDLATRAQYDACASTAAMAGCQAFANNAACAADSGVSTSSICLAPTFEAFYYGVPDMNVEGVVSLFCGSPPPPPDAGGEGGRIGDAAAEGPSDASGSDAAGSADGSSSDAREDGASTDAPAADAPPTEASAD